jgi:hypothetical protein
VARLKNPASFSAIESGDPILEAVVECRGYGNRSVGPEVIQPAEEVLANPPMTTAVDVLDAQLHQVVLQPLVEDVAGELEHVAIEAEVIALRDWANSAQVVGVAAVAELRVAISELANVPEP